MYILLLNALIDAARCRGDRTVVTGNDLAEILEEAKQNYLRRVEDEAERARAAVAARIALDVKRIGHH
ncbi:MAG TPA: hypothetical protein VJ553_00200 [Candidatus Paceibacterota bacterium]|nr:hypothetical protein [Candidatus Paceibacterota bacterium]